MGTEGTFGGARLRDARFDSPHLHSLAGARHPESRFPETVPSTSPVFPHYTGAVGSSRVESAAIRAGFVSAAAESLAGPADRELTPRAKGTRDKLVEELTPLDGCVKIAAGYSLSNSATGALAKFAKEAGIANEVALRVTQHCAPDTTANYERATRGIGNEL